jgi:hypothetical protein
VVGLAMGFAVIPIIFTITEDAFSSVPSNLTAASLALGASRWQTALRVVLPTASPGIFSAVMVGFGRAVGETMIVLMATGNTPVMDWSIFNGMRTLSANIAVEIPEAPNGGTLYRVLFLAALLLFGMTFVVNTVAEVVRQRLRERYKALMTAIMKKPARPAGESLVWFTASALGLCLLMIGGLIAVILTNGLGFFWPRPLVEFTLKDGSKRLAEVAAHEGIPNPGHADHIVNMRTLLKVGNRDLNRCRLRMGERRGHRLPRPAEGRVVHRTQRVRSVPWLPGADRRGSGRRARFVRGRGGRHFSARSSRPRRLIAKPSTARTRGASDPSTAGSNRPGWP